MWLQSTSDIDRFKVICIKYKTKHKNKAKIELENEFNHFYLSQNVIEKPLRQLFLSIFLNIKKKNWMRNSYYNNFQSSTFNFPLKKTIPWEAGWAFFNQRRHNNKFVAKSKKWKMKIKTTKKIDDEIKIRFFFTYRLKWILFIGVRISSSCLLNFIHPPKHIKNCKEP